MNSMPYIILTYIVALSLPGLFSIETKSIAYAIYQIICILFLIFFIFINYIKYRKKITFPKPALYFVALYLSILTPSVVYSTYIAIANGDSIANIAQFILPIVLCSSLMIGSSYSKLSALELDKIMKFILLFILTCALYNMVINYETILSLSSINGSYDVDIKGFFTNRNVFGYMMACGMACGTVLFSKYKKPITLVIITIIGANLFFAMSRGAILFFLVFLTLFILSKTKNKIGATLVLTMLLALLAGVLFNNTFVQNNIIRSDNGDTGRSELRSYGIQRFIYGNIVLGEGQNAIKEIEKEFKHSSFHNLYIETLATQGLLGFAALIICTIYIWINIKQLKRYDLTYYSFFLSFFVAYLLYCTVEALPTFYATPNSIMTTYILILLPLFVLNFYKVKSLRKGIKK